MTTEKSELAPVGLIVARARGGAIGRGNQLLFRIKEDLAHFKRETMGGAVLMGRKTFESIGRPLPGRHNVVVSRDPRFRAQGVTAAFSFEEGLAVACQLYWRGGAMPYVIGGAEVYAQALPYVSKLVVTEVDRDAEGADAFFRYPEDEFRVTESHKGEAPDVTFVYLERAIRFCPSGWERVPPSGTPYTG